MADADGDLATLGDLALYERIRRGSDEAAAELQRRHLHALQTVAAGYDRADRDRDATIDATVAALATAPPPASDGEVVVALFVLLRAARAGAASRGPGPVGLADLVPGAPRTEHRVLFDAFATLDERDQVLLWFAAVEGALPTQLAERLLIGGADLAATMVHRARSRLRAAYATLRAQQAGWPERCVAEAPLVARLTDGEGPGATDDADVDHVATCPRCQLLAAELAALPTQLAAAAAARLTGADAADGGAGDGDREATRAMAPLVVTTTPELSDAGSGAGSDADSYVDDDEPTGRRTGAIVGVIAVVVAVVIAVVVWQLVDRTTKEPTNPGSGAAVPTSSTSTTTTSTSSTSSTTSTTTTSTSSTTSTTTTTTTPSPSATDASSGPRHQWSPSRGGGTTPTNPPRTNPPPTQTSPPTTTHPATTAQPPPTTTVTTT